MFDSLEIFPVKFDTQAQEEDKHVWQVWDPHFNPQKFGMYLW